MRHPCLKFFAISILILSFCPWLNAQSDSRIFTLETNKSIEHNISPGEAHIYRVNVLPDSFLQIVIDQKSVDLRISLNVPGETGTEQTSGPDFARGPEQIFLITSRAETYELQIEAVDTEPGGRYRVFIETLRPVRLPADRDRLRAQRLFAEAEELVTASDHAGAIARYAEALQVIGGQGAIYDEASILYRQGRTYRELGDLARANANFRRSLALFQTGGSWDELFKNLGTLYLLMGGKEKTFDYLAEALPLVRALRNQRLEAILLNGLANISEDLNDPGQSVAFNGHALELFRITGKRGSEIFNMTEMADGDLSLEDKKKAIGYLNQAAVLARGASDKRVEASLFFGIGYIYVSIDEFQNALEYFQRSLPLWRSLDDSNGEAFALKFIGLVYYQLGDPFISRDYLESSLALFRETADARAEAQTVSLLGVIAGQVGDQQTAFGYFGRALRVFEDTGDRHGQASAHNRIAALYWTIGDDQKAVAHYKRSLRIWREENYREGEAVVLTSLGFISNARGEHTPSLKNHRQALEIFRLLGNLSGEAAALYGLANAEFAEGRSEKALEHIKTAVGLIETIRTRIAATDLRSTFLSTYRHYYEFYVFLLMQLSRDKPAEDYVVQALQVSERAKARGLLDSLTETRLTLRQEIDPALLAREESLQERMNHLALKKRIAGEKGEIDHLDKKIRRLTAELRDLRGEIKTRYKRYGILTQPRTLDLSDIRQQLDEDTLLLEYFLGERKSYLWLVSKDNVSSYVLPGRRDIEEKARVFYNALKMPESRAEAELAADDLSRMILGPAEEKLLQKRLLIVAEGVLQYIPFAALPVRSTIKSDPAENTGQSRKNRPAGKNRQPLILKHEIVYLPSVSALATLREETAGRRKAEKTIAVFADPVFSADDTRVGSPITDAARNQTRSALKATAPLDILRSGGLELPRLPGTRSEAARILSLVPAAETMRAIGFDANVQAVKDPQLARFRIIHLATHGLLNSQHPELSGIVFSLIDKNGRPQNGFLRLHEIYRLWLPSDLIVLSACQTALGKDIRGEGLVGLTRGFMLAGSARVLASLWAVDDRATSELMVRFYRGMLGEKRLRPAAALREAQISLLRSRRFAGPYHWSAFVLKGEWQ